jgi:hypothetical protein
LDSEEAGQELISRAKAIVKGKHTLLSVRDRYTLSSQGQGELQDLKFASDRVVIVKGLEALAQSFVADRQSSPLRPVYRNVLPSKTAYYRVDDFQAARPRIPTETVFQAGRSRQTRGSRNQASMK